MLYFLLSTLVLTLYIDVVLSLSMGVRRTVDQVKRRFHWPGLRKDVKLHIRCCKVCNANKMPYWRFRAALANFRVGAPLDRIGVDLMGPLPVTDQGNRYLLVIVDYFTSTRWAEAFSLPDQQLETLARTLVLEFVCRYGAPLELHSDQGQNFESALFQEVCRLFEIVKTRTSPYHPSGKGLVERFNRTLGSLIRSYLKGRPSDWDKFIPLLTSAYRSTPYPSTGFSPNFLMFGREVTAPVDLLFPHPPRTPSQDVPEYVVGLTERLHECYELARNTLRSAAERQKQDHDTRVVQNLYEPGALVMKRFHRHKSSRLRGWALLWLGKELAIASTWWLLSRRPWSSIMTSSNHMKALMSPDGLEPSQPLLNGQNGNKNSACCLILCCFSQCV